MSRFVVNRWDEVWRELRCSDCDPTLLSPDEEPLEWDAPFCMAIPASEVTPSHCPRCKSYLSLCDGDDNLMILTKRAQSKLKDYGIRLRGLV